MANSVGINHMHIHIVAQPRKQSCSDYNNARAMATSNV